MTVSDAPAPRFSRKGLATRIRIIDTTAGLMFDRGVAGTSVEDVRGAAGVSGSQLTHYFRDKHELTREVIAARQEQVQNFHTQPSFGAFDSIEALEAWVRACIVDARKVYRKGGCIYGSLVGELIDADQPIRDDLAAGYDHWIALFRAGLTAMKKRGDLVGAADPRHLAACLVAAHQGGAMLTHITGDTEPLRANVTAAVDYVRSFVPAPKPATRRAGRRS
jgi:TetR/AcrR family transcriptional regulator, transcriptional repressor for nem operon